MIYVDVILPVPVNGLFTYAVPDSMEKRAKAGMRVLVPFGRSKTYTGIIAREHVGEKPDFKVKDIYSFADDMPMLLPQQLRIWQWISTYYMCSIGDVYKAAMPQGLKEEDGYRPRMETYVGLHANMIDERSIVIAHSMLGRAIGQKRVLDAYLELSKGGREITREELMNSTHCTSAIINELKKKNILREYKKEVGRLKQATGEAVELPHALNEKQQDAYNGIMMQFMKKNVVLLHGVTSSGKTEIYIHLISQAIKEHKQVLYLLPEIALTVQITTRLQRVFGNKLGIYHSKYSDAERVEIWKKQLSDNPYSVILGARSAVFLPFTNLGLVIIDEEHETSFKQQEPAPRYHARSVAIMLAQMYGAKTLLGTATPSVDSYYNVRQNKYGLVELKERYKGIELPDVHVIDVKDLRHRKMMNGPLSPDLMAGIRKALDKGEQVILFQNRRGFSPIVECKQCGWTPRCENCDVSLTYHKNTNTMVCHYCGYTYKVPQRCPNCESDNLISIGFGTEKIEEVIQANYPDARIGRMDLDTTHTRGAYERLINDFSTGKTNILIGTQMVTKGLDFDNVSLVGILDADSMLKAGDFRAAERAFTMMEQVSGRAGRKGKRGTVMLQTREADSPVIKQVVNNDYADFYLHEIAERVAFKFPPVCNMIYIYLRHSNERLVSSAAPEFASRLRQWLGNRVLGPAAPPVGRVRKYFIQRIMLRPEKEFSRQALRKYLLDTQSALLADKRYAAIQIYYDVDPM